MYHVVVSLKVKPEMREKFLAAALDDHTCSTRDEPGCLRFDVVQSNKDPSHFFFYEVYKDEAAFKAHQGMPHYARWRAVVGDLMAEPPSGTHCSTIFPAQYR